MATFNPDKFVAWVELESKGTGIWTQRFEGDNGHTEAYEYANNLRALIGKSGIATVEAGSNKVVITLAKAAVH